MTRTSGHATPVSPAFPSFFPPPNSKIIRRRSQRPRATFGCIDFASTDFFLRSLHFFFSFSPLSNLGKECAEKKEDLIRGGWGVTMTGGKGCATPSRDSQDDRRMNEPCALVREGRVVLEREKKEVSREICGKLWVSGISILEIQSGISDVKF